MNDFNTEGKSCQQIFSENFKADAQRKLAKLQLKKVYNKSVIDWLIKQKKTKETEIAYEIYQCATFIEFSDIGGQAKISRANFCRNRVCNVCAWRRQAKFLGQINPILAETSREGYEFVFTTLTVRNTSLKALGETIDKMMKAYNKFLGRQKINRAFVGSIRSVEITYNPDEETYHPHMHILSAVNPDYFFNPDKYISQSELTCIWRECLGVNYNPICHIEKVSNTSKAEVETIKYALKPSQYEEALEGFYYVLKGRRLISFSGIFSKYRKEFDKEQDGNLIDERGSNLYNAVAFHFDSTGGIYKFLNTYESGERDYEEFKRICRAVEDTANRTNDNPAKYGSLVGNPKVYI